MQFFFQSINCNPIESEVEIDKENTRKEKDDEKNVDFFWKKNPQHIYLKSCWLYLLRLWKIKYHFPVWDDIHKWALNSSRGSVWHLLFAIFYL